MPEVRIIARGEGYAVVDKPPNFLSVPGKGPGKQDCAAARVRALFPDATGPLVVHRLDWETSGLLVFGLTPDAQRALSRQFERRQVEKAYVALVEGRVAPDAGLIEAPIRLDVEHRPRRVVDHALGQTSTTRFRVLAREVDRTRLLLEPVTGRTHQLRVHLSAPPESGGLGHAIQGDVLYGSEASRRGEFPRLMLHAFRLSFLEPGTGRRVAFESPAPF
ncbi:MAG: RluA family pseudouridine synthase [Phycisphaerae bacterium]|nr:RluA family pseudouridine synthase [Phycisphaerae bacterium]